METQTAIKTLIVEHSVPTRRMLRARLETMGCTIVGEAENQSHGLKLFRELQPQVVTLDLVMPQVDALTTEELFKIIRAEKPGASVIVISWSSKALTAVKYISQGAIDFQEKPFVNFDQIRDKLDFLYPQIMSYRGRRAPASQSMLMR